MGDAARGEGVLERADQRFLADQRREPGRAVGAGEDPVGGGALQLRLHRPERAGQRRRKAGRRPGSETRYGCFLPDLTGLARAPSTASLPRGEYRPSAPASARVQAGRGCAIAGRLSSPRSTPDATQPPAAGLRRHWPRPGRASPARRRLAGAARAPTRRTRVVCLVRAQGPDAGPGRRAAAARADAGRARPGAAGGQHLPGRAGRRRLVRLRPRRAAAARRPAGRAAQRRACSCRPTTPRPRPMPAPWPTGTAATASAATAAAPPSRPRAATPGTAPPAGATTSRAPIPR